MNIFPEKKKGILPVFRKGEGKGPLFSYSFFSSKKKGPNPVQKKGKEKDSQPATKGKGKVGKEAYFPFSPPLVPSPEGGKKK